MSMHNEFGLFDDDLVGDPLNETFTPSGDNNLGSNRKSTSSSFGSDRPDRSKSNKESFGGTLCALRVQTPFFPLGKYDMLLTFAREEYGRFVYRMDYKKDGSWFDIEATSMKQLPMKSAEDEVKCEVVNTHNNIGGNFRTIKFNL